MKKFRTLTAAIALCMGMIPIQALPCSVPEITANAETSDTIEYNGMSFKVHENTDELTLISYSGNEENLTIPETIDGKTVTAIESKAFWGNRAIVNVTLPDTIDYFGYDVFAYSYVESVNIPKSLKVIPVETFYRCTYLENVEFHDDIICIAKSAFEDTYIEPDSSLICDGAETSYAPFTKIHDVWEMSISSVGKGNYSIELIKYSPKSSSSTDIVIPDEYFGFPVTVIDLQSNTMNKFSSVEFPSYLSECYGDFKNHTELKNITFKSSDLIIGDNAFSNTSITELTLHGSSEIGKQAFYGCKDLKQVTFDGNPEIITISDDAFRECISLEKVIIPENCKQLIIGKNAFQNTNIKEIEINGDCKIETDVFKYAPLNSITFNGDTEIVFGGFSESESLKEITFNGNVSLVQNTFMNCPTLKNINISGNITGNAFNGCTNLTSINGEQVFDSSTGDFKPEYRDFIMNNFNLADDIGFINQYVKSQVKKIVSENITPDMNDMQKIRTLHDWVCNHTSYSPAGQESHNDAAILMNDTTVCEGYSRLCNLLYHEAGLETYYVTGVNHAWNIVKIDNHYFHVDSTWDDSNDEINYKWFCKSDSEMKNAGGNHASWKTAVISSLHDFQENISPECNYQMGDMNTDNEINIADMVKLEKYLLNAEKPDNHLILSDLNFDGNTDVFDMIEMRKIIIEK